MDLVLCLTNALRDKHALDERLLNPRVLSTRDPDLDLIVGVSVEIPLVVVVKRTEVVPGIVDLQKTHVALSFRRELCK